jgi:hypothetical protein
MSEGFTRTPTGVVGSRYFFPKPIVWVEGPTDIYFYEPVIGELNCVIKVFHGSSNASALMRGLLDNDFEYPYAVILDGDYSILTPQRSVHRWVIILRRYSFENYLWEKTSLNRSCLKHAQCGDGGDAIGEDFERIESELLVKLREAIELDIAARMCDPAPKVLPPRVEALLMDQDTPDICPAKVAAITEAAKAQIPNDIVRRAKADVRTFLRSGKISWLLNGHVLFGIIQRVFTKTSASIRGKKVILNDDALTQLLAEMVWRCVPSDEHRRLRRKLVGVVRELNSASTPS